MSKTTDFKTLSIKVSSEDLQRFNQITHEIHGNQQDAFLHLLDSFDNSSVLFPTDNQLKERVAILSKEISLYKACYPAPNGSRVKTSELKSQTDISARRMATEKLLTTSLEKLNGGESLFPLASFFSFDLPKLDQVLELVNEGKYLQGLKDKWMKEAFPAELIDFLELLDSGGSTNVTSLREIHKLVV